MSVSFMLGTLVGRTGYLLYTISSQGALVLCDCYGYKVSEYLSVAELRLAELRLKSRSA